MGCVVLPFLTFVPGSISCPSSPCPAHLSSIPCSLSVSCQLSHCPHPSTPPCCFSLFCFGSDRVFFLSLHFYMTVIYDPGFKIYCNAHMAQKPLSDVFSLVIILLHSNFSKVKQAASCCQNYCPLTSEVYSDENKTREEKQLKEVGWHL